MSTSASLDYVYRYPFSSAFSEEEKSPLLTLATSRTTTNEYPYFFEGRLLQPRIVARLLTSVSKVVSTRYYTPPGMLANILAAADPVITSGSGTLRFEGFSACCGAYARVDISPDAYEGKVVTQGTTNVDFNAPMRAALARVRDHDVLSMGIGPSEMMLKKGLENTVERKVQLPIRWLKGFVEVQAYQALLKPMFDVPQAEALKFLRSLPRNAHNRSVFWLVPAGKGIRLSQTASKDGSPVSGLDRLQLLQDLAPMCDRLQIFVHPSGEACEWVLHFGPISFHMAITAEVSRGFSGEGQALSSLVNSCHESTIAKVKAALKWQSVIVPGEIAKQSGLDLQDIASALSALGSRGIVGFDVNESAYFHREFPFDLSQVSGMHPRLKNAQKIIDGNSLKLIERTPDFTEIEVEGSGVLHRVRLSEQTKTCTCQWHAKYQGNRGPCKHILAAQMLSE